MKKRILSLFLLLSVFLTGCGTETVPTEKEEKLQVVTSFYPIYLLAQAATEGAENVELKNMAQPQTGCLHEYELTIDDMKLLEGADVLIINGGGMEGFLEQAMERCPNLTIVDTSCGIELLQDEMGHDHDHEAEASEAEIADAHGEEGNPHIWLSPMRAAEQVENITAALCELDEKDTSVFEANAAAFRKAAEGLQAQAEKIGLPAGEYTAVFHEGFTYLAELFHMDPVFGIFTDAYEMPSAKELAEAAEEAKLHQIRFFLTAADDGRIYAETLAAEQHEEVVLLDPLTTADEENRSYLERMEQNIKTVEGHWKEVTK